MGGCQIQFTVSPNRHRSTSESDEPEVRFNLKTDLLTSHAHIPQISRC